MKERIYEIIEKAEAKDILSKIFDYTIIILILGSIIAVVLESFSGFESKYRNELNMFEMITVVIFSVEYFLRIWTAELKYPNKKVWVARIVYAFSFMGEISRKKASQCPHCGKTIEW